MESCILLQIYTNSLKWTGRGKDQGHSHVPNERRNLHRYTHGDEHQRRQLGPCGRLQPAPHPQTPMDTQEPSGKEISEAVKKARSAAVPGLNDLSDKVYKV